MDLIKQYLNRLGIQYNNGSCDICNVVIETNLGFLYHAYSQDHKRRAIDLNHNFVVTKEVLSLDSVNEKKYCFICDQQLEASTNEITHKKTAEHIANVYIYKIIQIVNEEVKSCSALLKEFGYYKCTYCNLNLSGAFESFDHAIVKSHAADQADLSCNKVLKWHSINEDLYCKMCSKAFTTNRQVLAHISRAEHKEACFRMLLSQDGITIMDGDQFQCVTCSESFGLFNALGHAESASHASQLVQEQERQRQADMQRQHQAEMQKRQQAEMLARQHNAELQRRAEIRRLEKLESERWKCIIS